MSTEKRQMSFGAYILNMVISAVFFPAILLAAGGNLRWVEGWLFGLWFDVMLLSIISYQFFKDPALLAERTRLPGSGNQKNWDKVLMGLIYIQALAWFVLMPLDAERFSWSPAFPLWIKVLGGLILLPALFFMYRATADNTFLSAMVRIQDDRKQRVISGGVYGFVRHPLYLGCLLLLTGAPLLLGSLVGVSISLVAVLTLIYRILGEEIMLVEELDGYREYQQKVKYRLIPFVW